MVIFFIPSIYSLYKSFYSVDSYSSGGQIRILVSIAASFLFLLNKKKYKLNFKDEKIVFIFSIMNIILFLISFKFSSAADRLHLYIMPIQFIVFSNYIYLLNTKRLKQLYISVIYIFYIIIFYVWINLGTYAVNWYPYNNILLLNSEEIEYYYNNVDWKG